jgi:hypothetical protein
MEEKHSTKQSFKHALEAFTKHVSPKALFIMAGFALLSATVIGFGAMSNFQFNSSSSSAAGHWLTRINSQYLGPCSNVSMYQRQTCISNLQSGGTTPAPTLVAPVPQAPTITVTGSFSAKINGVTSTLGITGSATVTSQSKLGTDTKTGTILRSGGTTTGSVSGKYTVPNVPLGSDGANLTISVNFTANEIAGTSGVKYACTATGNDIAPIGSTGNFIVDLGLATCSASPGEQPIPNPTPAPAPVSQVTRISVKGSFTGIVPVSGNVVSISGGSAFVTSRYYANTSPTTRQSSSSRTGSVLRSGGNTSGTVRGQFTVADVPVGVYGANLNIVVNFTATAGGSSYWCSASISDIVPVGSSGDYTINLAAAKCF